MPRSAPFLLLLTSIVYIYFLPSVLACSVSMVSQVRFPSLLFSFVVSLLTPFVDSGTVSNSLLSKINTEEEADAVLELPSIMDSVISNPLLNLLSGDLKTLTLINLLKKITLLYQSPFISVLRVLGFEKNIEPFWITNKVLIRNANMSIIETFSRRPGPFTMREPVKFVLVQRSAAAKANVSNLTDQEYAAEWGVAKIGAPKIWESTTTGENVIVAGIDTGVLKEHEALLGNYAGGWFDAVSRKKEPYDDHGHGTHTMGTMAGQFGIGVAPGSKWIACKGLDFEGTGDDTQLSKCAEFVLSFKPTPKVVCNAWGSPDPNSFYNHDEITAWQTAGIIPIFAVGNSGPTCNSVWSPTEQPNLISVGVTDASDKILAGSSRGYGNGKQIKPEVSAPGQNIVSAFYKGTSLYALFSGSSMAAPHVAGAVALMLSANPQLKFKDVVNKLATTAVRPQLEKSDLNCGPVNGNWPNNAYGYGRINVNAAMAE